MQDIFLKSPITPSKVKWSALKIHQTSGQLTDSNLSIISKGFWNNRGQNSLVERGGICFYLPLPGESLRTYGDVITKFSRMDSLSSFIARGDPLRAPRARGGSAKNDFKNQYCVFPHPLSNLFTTNRRVGSCVILIGQNYAGVAPYTGATSLVSKQVCFGPGNSQHLQILLQNVKVLSTFGNDYFATCNNLICCKRGLISVGGNQLLSATNFTTMV